MLFLALFVALVAAEPEWSLARDAHPTEEVTFSLALKQRNIPLFRSMVEDLSNPLSSNYANWMSIEEINEIIAPKKSVRADLKKKLALLGVAVHEDRGDSFVVKAPAAVVERVFSTNVTVHRHVESKRLLHKCDAYTIPSSLTHVVEFLVGLQELPRKSMTGPKVKKEKIDLSRQSGPPYGSIIPGFLRLIYNIPQTTFSASSSLCLVEFLDYSSFSFNGLNGFLQQTNNPSWNVSHIVGPFAGQGLESILDIQYGGTLARGSTIWFWTGQRWLLDFAQEFFATSTVPTVVSMSWGWPSDSMCAQENGPGQCVSLTSFQYSSRVDTEFMKISARGVTLVGASGDQGAPGDDFYQCTPGVSDILPASSNWVTAVGATQLGAKPAAESKKRANPFGAPVCSTIKCADGSTLYEVTCSTSTNALITSGGGFSYLFPQPSWQKSAVASYLSKNPQLPPAGAYNASNRGFPDVSALGHNYACWQTGAPLQVDGTSASTPVFGAMVALWNSQRLAANKKTLGHIAPLMYQAYANNPSYFHDVTVGDNSCTESCCSSSPFYGYAASAGYDLATGLGTPNWGKLSQYIATLP